MSTAWAARFCGMVCTASTISSRICGAIKFPYQIALRGALLGNVLGHLEDFFRGLRRGGVEHRAVITAPCSKNSNGKSRSNSCRSRGVVFVSFRILCIREAVILSIPPLTCTESELSQVRGVSGSCCRFARGFPRAASTVQSGERLGSDQVGSCLHIDVSIKRKKTCSETMLL